MSTSLLLFISLALTLFSTPQAAHHDEAVSYWKSFYPTIPIPSLVTQHISQMTDAEINTVVSMIHKKTLSSNVDIFCKTAGLVCSIDEISKDLLVSLRNCPASTYERTKANINMASAIVTNVTIQETLGVYFLERTLRKGALFNMGEIKREISPAKAFLPHSIASLLTLEQSGALFQSTTVRNLMNMAINMCSTQAAGEMTKCPSSVEELVKFSAEVFPDRRVKLVYPKSDDGTRTTVLLDNIRPVLRENPHAKLVACHRGLFFPYTIMYCHATSEVQVYQVDLVHPKTLKKINASMFAVCHRNTASWRPNHVAMTALRTRPGESAICHWMSTESIVFVHLYDTLTE